MSRGAFRRLGEAISRNFSFCEHIGEDDVSLARCLDRLSRGGCMVQGRSVDEQGRERFHFDSVKRHFYGTMPRWARKYSTNPMQKVSIKT